MFQRFYRSLVGASLAVMLVASPVFARTESNGAARVQYDVPDAWATTAQGNSVVVRAPTGGVAIEFHAITSRAELAAGLQQLETSINTHFQSVQYEGQPMPVTQRGLAGRIRRGAGMVNGQRVGFLAGFLGHSSGGLIFVAWVNQAGFAQNLPLIRAVLDSIRAMPMQ